MLGDTAPVWLLMCFLFLVLSPIWLLVEVNLALGALLKKTDIERKFDEEHRRAMSLFALGFSLLPLTLLVTCLLFPFVFLGRLWQISKLLFADILPHCVKKLCCCCCY